MKQLSQFIRQNNFFPLIVIFTLLCLNVQSSNAQIASTATSQTPTPVEIYPQYPKINYGTGEKADQLKRGEYLVKSGDCIACHTERNGQTLGAPFAGGLGFKTPFGTLYTPNITPDKETGIGNWTLDDFKKSFREGISPLGHYYYPAFPFYYFSKVTDDDVAAIKAYLEAIPAVNKKNYSNEMIFPFNWRFTQLGWRILFFNTKNFPPYQNDPAKPADWNRGAYLVQGLGHCSMCHTQMYYVLSKNLVLGAPNKKYYLGGAFVQGYYAPNITGSVMKEVSDEQLADVFKKNKLIGGGEVQGPMREANMNSLQHLSLEDIHAIATYLRSVQSESPPKQKLGSGLAAGQKIYKQYCAGCHMMGAGGAPKVGDSTDWEPRVKKGLPALFNNAINGIGAMPAKGTCTVCSDEDIQNAVKYMVQISTGKGATSSKSLAPPSKPLTLNDGKKIYEQHCSVCHDIGYKGAPKIGDQTAWKPYIDQGMETLIVNSLHGIRDMPPRGNCTQCNDAQVIAAVKYMVDKSKTKGNYNLW